MALQSKAVILPKRLNDQDTSCLIQLLSTVMNGIDRLRDIRVKSVAVVGLGSIGLFFCWLHKQRGAAHVTGIDPPEERCRVAKTFGAARTFSRRSIEHLHSIRQETTMWEPPDICIELVGHQMDNFNDCLEEDGIFKALMDTSYC